MLVIIIEKSMMRERVMRTEILLSKNAGTRYFCSTRESRVNFAIERRDLTIVDRFSMFEMGLYV